MIQTSPSTSRRRTVVSALLTLHAALLAWNAWCHSPTVDEPMHLAAGLYHWHTGRFDLDRGNPPLTGLVAALPLLAADPNAEWRSRPVSYLVGADFLAANGMRACWLTMLGRWALVPFSLLGGYISYRWATDLYGDSSGFLALTLWCVSPNAIAYGALVTGDMPATAMGALAAYAFWRWLNRPDYSRASVAGIVLGLAELTKYVWVLLYVLWPVLWGFWSVVRRQRDNSVSWRRQLIQLGLIFFVGLSVINLGYAYRGTLGSLGRYHIPQGHEERSYALDDTDAVAWLPVPLPEDYVAGIVEIAYVAKRKAPCYLHREWHESSPWYFYPYTILVKLPAGTLCLAIVALAMSLPCTRYEFDRSSTVMLSALIVAVIALAAASGARPTYRYILPAFPFAVILISRTGQLLSGQSRLPAFAVTAFLLCSIHSSLLCYPHSLSYVNEFAGGPTKADIHLIGDGIDWGQDFLYLKRWLDERHDASPVGMTWRHPSIDPRFIGIDHACAPPGLARDRRYSIPQLMELGPLPGQYAINTTALRDRSGCFAYFRCFQPIEHAGYSIVIYHISPDEANRVRRQLGLPRLLDIGIQQSGN